jgi:hypothetical protein
MPVFDGTFVAPEAGNDDCNEYVDPLGCVVVDVAPTPAAAPWCPLDEEVGDDDGAVR